MGLAPPPRALRCARPAVPLPPLRGGGRNSRLSDMCWVRHIGSGGPRGDLPAKRRSPMSFVVSALPAAEFQPLFGLSEAALAARGIVRRTVEAPGSPCRLTLEDAAVGETVRLLN